MKNVLEYFYSIHIDNIRLNGNNYFFQYNNENYILYQYNDEYKNLEKIYEIYLQVLNRGIYCHQIILNNNNQISTLYNNKNYVLLKYNLKIDNKISLNDIIYFGNITYGYKININWKDLWAKKIDYFEYQLSHVGKKYPIIRESFSYYVGLVEIGIILLNEKKEIIGSIEHNRLLYGENYLEFYNPLNFIIDVRVRDSAEYFKNKLKKEKDIFDDIKNYFIYSKLSENEIYYFFVRMLYPSFYFDCYESIINDNEEEYKIKEVIEITPYYEKTLKKLYQYLKKYIYIPEIEWLNKL